MSDKRTSSSLLIDQEGTTRSFTPLNSRTSRLDQAKRFLCNKRSVAGKLNKNFKGLPAAEQLAKDQAIIDPSNLITKRLIMECTTKIMKFKKSKKAQLAKQQELFEKMQNQRSINKELRAEELKLVRQIDDLGLQRVKIKETLLQMNTELAESKHKVLDHKMKYEKIIKKLQTTISELEKEKKETETKLERERYRHKYEMKEILNHKYCFNEENRKTKGLIKELEERNHLAAVAIEKSNTEFKDRVKELSSVVNKV